MKKTLKLGVILLIITVVAALILAFSNDATKDKIAEIEAEITRKALEDIFGEVEDMRELAGADLDEVREINKDVSNILEILQSNEVVGYSITTNPNGFNGPIEIMVGYDKDGNILGIRLLTHSETASIGSKAAEPEFTSKFENQNIDEDLDIEGISGATVTSSAVINGVEATKDVFTLINN